MDKKYRLLKLLEKNGFAFSFFTMKDEVSRTIFVKRNWPNSKTRYNLDYNNWKFRKNEPGSDLNIILAKKDDEVVGQLGLISAKIKVGDKIEACNWGCNFKVDDLYKNVGLGVGLDLFYQQNGKVLLGNSSTPEAEKYRKAIGADLLEGPATLMLPVKAQHLVSLKVKSPRIVKSSGIINPLLRSYLLLKTRKGKTAHWTTATAQQIQQRIDERRSKITIPHIVHDADFIKWRCNPPTAFKPATQLLINNSDEKSYVIYSVSGRVLNLYEYHFQTGKSLASFLKHLLHKEKSIFTVKAYANTFEEETLLKKTGFIALKTKCVISVYSEDNLQHGFTKMHVDLYDGDGDI